MRTIPIPVAVWQDAGGAFTARTLEGPSAVALDRTLADVLEQLKKFLAWQAREGIPLDRPEFAELCARDYSVVLRQEYELADGTYPVSEPFPLRITCVFGERADGTRRCVIPTIDVRFHFQASDPVDDLVAEMVRQALGKRTPQQLSRELMPGPISLHTIHVRQARAAHHATDEKFPTLESVAELIGRRTTRSRFSRALNRETEVNGLVARLDRDHANLLLVGESGVGRSTVLVEAIRRIARTKNKPATPADESISKRRFWLTSGQRLIAGMKYLGQWEERLEKVIEELAETRSVLCVDDLLELVRVGGREPAGSVAAFFMPYLERGELRMVSEATHSELDACRRLLPGFTDLFQIVRVEEFVPAAARELLGSLLRQGERDLKLDVEPGLADMIYRLFKRFQPYTAFPGRCADFVRHLLDAVGRNEDTRLAQVDVFRRFQQETGLPERLLRDDLTLPHEQVLADFSAAVLGQDEACQIAAGVVASLKTGLNDPARPLGVLLFCGPTGVGKTEMAKALSAYLFGASGAKDRLVRLDMSEYSTFGAANRLLLAADGGVSDFIKRVRRQPFAVVLFDEIEKAAPEVLDVLLGVLDEGRLTDRFGRTTTFRSALIVMTSNIGAERGPAIGFQNAAVPPFERIAAGTFRPEFLNRIDAIVAFQPLAHETILALARRELESVAKREGLLKSRLRLTWTDEVVAQLAAAGYDARYGARPLLRVVDCLVVAPLARWLLDNPTTRGGTLQLQWHSGAVEIKPA